MRKLYQNDELFSFFSGIAVSLACTVLYEAISNVSKYSVWKLICLFAASGFMIVSTLLLIKLSNETKDLKLRFQQVKGNRIYAMIKDELKQAHGIGTLEEWQTHLWNRAFRWRVNDDVEAMTGEKPTDETAKPYVKRLKKKLDCLAWFSLGFFVLAMLTLVVVQIIC
jgi:hypothetical protein